METKKSQKERWLHIFMFTNMQKHFKPKILPCNGMQNQTQHRKKKRGISKERRLQATNLNKLQVYTNLQH